MQTIILTNEILEQGRSCHGGWSNAQLRSLGVEIVGNQISPWRRKMVGQPIEKWRVDQFLQLRNAHLGEGDELFK